MSRNWSDRRVAWFIAGICLGVSLASYWPHEPAAYAEAAVNEEKFALCTCNTVAGEADAVFVLDYATGRLIGATFNNRVNQFSQPMIRNLAADFGLTEQGKFLMVPGFINARTRGGPQPATSGIYVAELTTGKLALYGFVNAQGAKAVQELTPLGIFPWRSAS